MDDRTFREALTEEIPRLRRLAGRLAGTRVEPEDLVQDVLERAWRSRERYLAQAALSTWLHRILVNRAIDLYRRDDPTRVGPLEQETIESLVDFEVDDADALLTRAADAAVLRAALSRLPDEERMVLALHDGEGWTAREVARICGLETATVHKRAQRARIRLARELAGAAGRARRPTEQCRRARVAAPAYLDDLLGDVDRRHIEEHLRSCARCPALVQALLGLRAALHSSTQALDLRASIARSLRRVELG